jgi:hypothetical protein
MGDQAQSASRGLNRHLSYAEFMATEPPARVAEAIRAEAMLGDGYPSREGRLVRWWLDKIDAASVSYEGFWEAER